MRLKSPSWWFAKDEKDDRLRWQAALLAPVGFLYGAVARTRFVLKKSYQARLPVICIGNYTLGGAGKTPTALTYARLLSQLGYQPVFLSRGYGGKLSGPHRVNPERDTASDVGDEPLLLAAHAPTVIARDRRAGAQFIERYVAGAGKKVPVGSRYVIIMDDGFQNPQLHKDISVIVLDGATGIGNGCVFPAGPLRAPLPFQLARTDQLIVNGAGQRAASLVQMLKARGRQVFQAQVRPVVADREDWAGRRVIAFAGIARPEKFFTLLERLGADVRIRLPYGDHQVYSEEDAAFLLALSAAKELPLVTTEKDFARMSRFGQVGRLRAVVKTLPVRLEIEGEECLKAKLAERLAEINHRIGTGKPGGGP